MKPALFAALLLAAVSAHASDNTVGCYDVLMSPVDKPGVQAKQDKAWIHAKPIHLTSQKVWHPWTGSVFQVVPAVPTDLFDYRNAYWKREKDQISIIWSNTGLTGAEMTLSPSPGGFEGVFREFWDVVTDTLTPAQRRVILKRRPC